ncbi:MAG TPA: hypothetical protein VF023_02055 [Bryobacteraceae bacterium]
MAVPIQMKPNTSETPERVLERLEEAQVKHAKAILASYALLQELHDSGAIDLCRGALGAKDTIVTKLSLAANLPESVKMARNLMLLGKILSTVDPEFLHRLADELSRPKPRKLGFFRAARILMGKDGRRVLAGSAAFVQAFSRALAKG